MTNKEEDKRTRERGEDGDNIYNLEEVQPLCVGSGNKRLSLGRFYDPL